ncbi:MAG: molybdopterin-dependent oxidoreductase [Acidimicrobiia bacterium]|nr:molybdopterin-dependent oxidoreductase [Acidimicrobiia bacterium]
MSASTTGGPGIGPVEAGVAGVVGGGVALGLTEFIAGVVDGAPSAIAAVGSFVVDRSPPFLKDFAISVFGTADKGALAIGTVVIALVASWFVGRAAASRSWVGPAVFGLFALVGIVAGLGEPLTSAPAVVGSILVSAGAGLAAMQGLLLAGRAPETPTDAVPTDAARRRFIGLAVAGGAVAATGGLVGRRLLQTGSEPPEVAFEPRSELPGPTAEQMFSIDGLEPIVVPNDEFYRIDTALVVPRIDEEAWTVRVTGMVDTPLEFTYADLQARDLVEQYVTIACVSNEVGGDLVGNAKWAGVRLVEILEEAGVQPDATQIVGRSVDGWTAGFPTELAFDGREPLLALFMNDEPLPADHGFPARLIVPGLYGYVSATKWLTEIELTTWEDFDGYWIPRGWAKEGPIKTQSRIDVPRSGQTVPAGETVVAGVAWAPLRGIERVELAVDDGDFQECELTDPLSSKAWVQWKTTVTLDPGVHRLRVRATDGTGDTQVREVSSPRPDGATGWHAIRVEVE